MIKLKSLKFIKKQKILVFLVGLLVTLLFIDLIFQQYLLSRNIDNSYSEVLEEQERKKNKFYALCMPIETSTLIDKLTLNEYNSIEWWNFPGGEEKN